MPEEILAQLVAIASSSPLSNAPMISCIRSMIEPLGWYERIHSYRDAAGVDKQNLLLAPQPFADGPVHAALAVVCHTDTVPPDTAWNDPLELREHDGLLHGLGACDVKGFLACMLATAHRLKPENISRPLCFVFTSDEEVGCRGARFLFESKVMHAQYAIVGEPTSLNPAHAGKGYCLASIAVGGKSGHSAYPGAGASAIFAAARLITRIESLAAELASDKDDVFDPPFTTINIGTIQGGTAKNVVPPECRFLLEWRPIPSQSPQLVLDHVRALADAVEHELGPHIRVQIDLLRKDPGFSTSPNSSVVGAVQTESSRPPQAIAFGTEAPWMARMGAEAVVVGPGSMLTAHSPHECVPIVELHRCTEMLLRAINALCG